MRDIAEHLPIIVVGVAVAIVVVQLFTSSNLYGQIGRGGLSVEEQRAPASGSAAERDDDIRQMLEARNARRARQGRPALDIEAEMSRLIGGGSAIGSPATTPDHVDPELVREVRQLVIARNARRERRGQPPLDVEL